jgi:hypothetical protein
VNLDSPDHHSHVSYPMGTNADVGDCPTSHPVRLPMLFYEILFSVEEFPHGNGVQPFRLSCGDSTGMSDIKETQGRKRGNEGD